MDSAAAGQTIQAVCARGRQTPCRPGLGSCTAWAAAHMCVPSSRALAAVQSQAVKRVRSLSVCAAKCVTMFLGHAVYAMLEDLAHMHARCAVLCCAVHAVLCVVQAGCAA